MYHLYQAIRIFTILTELYSSWFHISWWRAFAPDISPAELYHLTASEPQNKHHVSKFSIQTDDALNKYCTELRWHRWRVILVGDRQIRKSALPFLHYKNIFLPSPSQTNLQYLRVLNIHTRTRNIRVAVHQRSAQILQTCSRFCISHWPRYPFIAYKNPVQGKAIPVLSTEHHSMKVCWGSGHTAPWILDLGTRWRWVVSFTPRPLYPYGKSPWYPLIRGLGGPQSRSGKGGEEKNSQPLPGLEPPIIQPVAPHRIVTNYLNSYFVKYTTYRQMFAIKGVDLNEIYILSLVQICSTISYFFFPENLWSSSCASCETEFFGQRRTELEVSLQPLDPQYQN
jgi:hypothetical protein